MASPGRLLSDNLFYPDHGILLLLCYALSFASRSGIRHAIKIKRIELPAVPECPSSLRIYCATKSLVFRPAQDSSSAST